MNGKITPVCEVCQKPIGVLTWRVDRLNSDFTGTLLFVQFLAEFFRLLFAFARYVNSAPTGFLVRDDVGAHYRERDFELPRVLWDSDSSHILNYFDGF